MHTNESAGASGTHLEHEAAVQSEAIRSNQKQSEAIRSNLTWSMRRRCFSAAARWLSTSLSHELNALCTSRLEKAAIARRARRASFIISWKESKACGQWWGRHSQGSNREAIGKQSGRNLGRNLGAQLGRQLPPSRALGPRARYSSSEAIKEQSRAIEKESPS